MAESGGDVVRKIERDVIARGAFASVGDLRRKLMRYIRAYAKRARPIRWTYTDPQTADCH